MRLRAGLKSQPYSRHRHDTYSISVTRSGVQEFDYRGAVHRSLPGQVVVLHPDELHDGRPGTDASSASRVKSGAPATTERTNSPFSSGSMLHVE